MNGKHPAESKDKVVVITGGAQGIGKYCANRFAEEGASVYAIKGTAIGIAAVAFYQGNPASASAPVEYPLLAHERRLAAQGDTHLAPCTIWQLGGERAVFQPLENFFPITGKMAVGWGAGGLCAPGKNSLVRGARTARTRSWSSRGSTSKRTASRGGSRSGRSGTAAARAS